MPKNNGEVEESPDAGYWNYRLVSGIAKSRFVNPRHPKGAIAKGKAALRNARPLTKAASEAAERQLLRGARAAEKGMKALSKKAASVVSGEGAPQLARRVSSAANRVASRVYNSRLVKPIASRAGAIGNRALRLAKNARNPRAIANYLERFPVSVPKFIPSVGGRALGSLAKFNAGVDALKPLHAQLALMAMVPLSEMSLKNIAKETKKDPEFGKLLMNKYLTDATRFPGDAGAGYSTGGVVDNFGSIKKAVRKGVRKIGSAIERGARARGQSYGELGKQVSKGIRGLSGVARAARPLRPGKTYAFSTGGKVPKAGGRKRCK